MIKHITPLNVSFENLHASAAWTKLRDYVRDLIKQEQDAFFTLDDNMESNNAEVLRGQRLKVKHFSELWDKIEVYVLNSARKGGQNGQ